MSKNLNDKQPPKKKTYVVKSTPTGQYVARSSSSISHNAFKDANRYQTRSSQTLGIKHVHKFGKKSV